MSDESWKFFKYTDSLLNEADCIVIAYGLCTNSSLTSPQPT